MVAGVTPFEGSQLQGEPFTPLGRCRIATTHGVYILEPVAPGGGQFTFLPGDLDLPGDLGPVGDPSQPDRPDWVPFGWVRWMPDEEGPGFRMRIGTGEPGAEVAVMVTGPVLRIHGDFTTDPDADALSGRPRGAARLGRLLRFTLP